MHRCSRCPLDVSLYSMSALFSVPGSNPGSHITLNVHSLLELHDAVFLFKIYLFTFLAVLGLPYCPRAFSSCRDWGLFSEQCAGFSLQWLLLLWHGISCTSKWDLPGPGIEPVSPTLAGEFLSTRPPVKPTIAVLK